MASIDQTLDPVVDLSALIDADEVGPIAEYLREKLPPEETSYTISHLDDERRTAMLAMLAEAEPEFAADLMEHFDDAHAAEYVSDLEPEAAAAIVDEMDSDEQADVLSEMDDQDAEAILGEMSPEEAIDARQRLLYDEDTAGGLMITEFLAYPAEQTVDTVADDLREHGDEYGEYEVRYIYSVNDERRLVGMVPMRRLVMSPRGTHIARLILEDSAAVHVDTHVDELEDLFDRIDFSAVPVVDADEKLVGVVQRAAVQEARGEAAEEDLAKFGGIVRGEELRSMPVWSRAARRLAYLLPISVLLMLSASVIHLFIEVIERVPVLAMFLPVVAGLCGSGGGQAVAVSMREISLGLIKPADLVRVMLKEASVAFVNGIVLGAFLLLIVWVWQGSFTMGIVVGGSIPLVLVAAKVTGGCVPLILRKIGLDPAMASGPVVTTVVDLVSFLAVLILATLLLGHLTPAG